MPTKNRSSGARAKNTRTTLRKAAYRALGRLGRPGRVLTRAVRLGLDFAGAIFQPPDRISARLVPTNSRYDASQLPKPIKAPKTPVRLLIAPANYAAQGYAWARAVENLPGVGAVNMQVRGDQFGFPADYSIELRAFQRAYHWSRKHRKAVATQFSHVLFEAELPILGRVSGFSIRREVTMLREAGVAVAFVSHGSDLRLPSRHAIDEWSPFLDATDPWVQGRESRARSTNQLLNEIGAPIFVVTPELLVDRPDAIWLPNVVSPERWSASSSPLSGKVPRVLHAPTNGVVKGTHLIEPVTHELHRLGVIEYISRHGVPSAEMPDQYRAVDVVLEQFRLGIYSTTAIEAMAAGRVVVAYLRDQVREHVRSVSGLDVPIVQATPDTLDQVLRDISSRPDHYREIAAQGPQYVRAIHDGTYSARVLARFLTQDPTTRSTL